MKNFATLLNRLYFTYGHRDKMVLIEHYLAKTPDPERGYAVAIMANTLEFPTFRRAMIKELIKEHIDPYLFELSYDYIGDISDTIALLWPDTKPGNLPLLSELITQCNKLSQQELKSYLADLLNRSNTIERWALLKLGTGSLRIGISARFLKNTLAEYGKINVQDLEKVWHGLHPPYIELFAWLEHQHPLPEIAKNFHFHPVMLSHPINEKEIENINADDFFIERKYDGIRVQIVSTSQGKALYTRTGDNISHSFPDLLDTIKDNVILDGELVIKTEAGIGSFNALQQRLNRKTITKKLLSESPAAIIVYDILSQDGQDLHSLAFADRRKYLESWFSSQNADRMLLSDLLVMQNNQTLFQLKNQILEENHPAVEGLMLKHKNSPYLAGRPRGHWYKWKRDPLVIDAVLMYAQRGHGKRSSYYSDYTFGLWQGEELLPIGKAYFGFTDEELLKLDKWIRNNTIASFGPVREVQKALVFEVAFDAVNASTRHKSGLALRFPRINRIRWDKPAAEADVLVTLANLIRQD